MTALSRPLWKRRLRVENNGGFIGEKEIFNTIALTRVGFFSLTEMGQLYRAAGSATAIIEQRERLNDLFPGVSPRLVRCLSDMDEAFRRAETEMEFIAAHGITALPLSDVRYPSRLRDCCDAPLILFYKGNADLNPKHVLNIIGTRHMTVYGSDRIKQFIAELKNLCPDTLIVSGLAYGVDICAHRQALENGFPTVGVLAHGLDYLYPVRHKETAARMVKQGGLLTEFLTMTNADKMNFVRRNRIVAGMSDACVLVESAAHGGGLITARISQSYEREVFAFPGRAGDPYSEGCLNLIKHNVASLITSAEDVTSALGWTSEQVLEGARQSGIQRDLFPDLSAEERLIVHCLQEKNDLPLDFLTYRSGLPVQQLSSLLFSLEMKGVVRQMAGGVTHLHT